MYLWIFIFLKFERGQKTTRIIIEEIQKFMLLWLLHSRIIQEVHKTRPRCIRKALKIHAFMELAFSRIIQEEYKNIPGCIQSSLQMPAFKDIVITWLIWEANKKLPRLRFSTNFREIGKCCAGDCKELDLEADVHLHDISYTGPSSHFICFLKEFRNW